MEKNNKQDSNTKIVYDYSIMRKDITRTNPLHNNAKHVNYVASFIIF
jgi:hypothetical protein